MQVVVIIGHQHQGSFNHAIAATAIEELKAAGHRVIFHDLYAEGFDPVLTHDEIARDAVLPAEIETQIAEVLESDGYLVVHPNWWGQPPAVLKGWIDRIFRQGRVYTFGPSGVIGKLEGKRAVVITTSNTPRDVELAVFNDPLENLWKNCVFGFCGVKDFLRRNFESIVLSSPEQRQSWLDEVRKIVRERFPA